MNTIPWYRSAVLRQQLVQIVLSLLTIFGVASDQINLDDTIGAVFGGIAGVTALWTFFTRLTKPHPPITEVAAEKQMQFNRTQGGFVRPLLLACVLAIALPTTLAMHGCVGSGTKAAYSEAQNLGEQAYVLAEHYAALVEQAANLAQKPGTPVSVITRMQTADRFAKPAVLKLKPLRDAFVAGKTVQTEVELQAAVNEAVRAIAEFVRSINAAKETVR